MGFALRISLATFAFLAVLLVQGAIMIIRPHILSSIVVASWALTVFGAVDERPLPVTIVPAFPQLAWPDSITGADVGKTRDPRPLLITGAGDGTNRIFAASEYGTIQ